MEALSGKTQVAMLHSHPNCSVSSDLPVHLHSLKQHDYRLHASAYDNPLPTKTQADGAEEPSASEQHDPAQADGRVSWAQKNMLSLDPLPGRPSLMTGAQSLLSPRATPQSQHKQA